mgnify:CR=1 FL=1
MRRDALVADFNNHELGATESGVIERQGGFVIGAGVHGGGGYADRLVDIGGCRGRVGGLARIVNDDKPSAVLICISQFRSE